MDSKFTYKKLLNEYSTYDHTDIITINQYLLPNSLGFSTQISYNNNMSAHNHSFYEIFYVLSGNLEHTINGVKSNITTLVKVYDSWVYIKNGKQSFDTTLFKYKGTWVYINNGYLDKYSDTLVKYSGKWYHVKNGKLAKDTAIVYYNGRRYYVKNGTVRFIDGIVKVNGLSYWINDGVVYTQTLYR